MSNASKNTPSAAKENPIPLRGPEDPTKIYKGGCHCGKFTFELEHPVIEDGFEVLSCNCSICAQRGYLFVYTMEPEKHFTLTKGTRAELAVYKFGPCAVAHIFCPVCGSGIFEEVKKGTLDLVGVNARAIPGLDLDSLKLKKVNGRDEL